MPYKLSPLHSALPPGSERLLDYDYISDEGFVFAVALTSNACLMVYEGIVQASLSIRTKRVHLTSIFGGNLTPSLVALSPDLSTILLITTSLPSNCVELLLLPTRLVLDASWAKSSCFCDKAERRKLWAGTGLRSNNGQTEHETAAHDKPTSAFCFNSSFTSNAYLVIAYKLGSIYLVDLHTMLLTATFDVGMPIENVQIYPTVANSDCAYMLLTSSSVPAQCLLIPVERNGSVRETLARAEQNVVKLDNGYTTYFPWWRGAEKSCSAVVALNNVDMTVKLHSTLLPTRCNTPELSKRTDHVLLQTRLAYIDTSNRLMVSVLEDNQLLVLFPFISPAETVDPSPLQRHKTEGWINVPIGDITILAGRRILGFIPIMPVYDHEESLPELILVSEGGLVHLQPGVSVAALIAEHLITEQVFFSREFIDSLCTTLKWEAKKLAMALIREILKKGRTQERTPAQAALLDALISLALEAGVEMAGVYAVFNEYGDAPHLLPFLRLRCASHPADEFLAQLLFSALFDRLRQMPPSETGNGQRQLLERELHDYLAHFKESPQSCLLPMLLKECLSLGLWSCVAVVLARSPTTHSAVVARALVDNYAWGAVTPSLVPSDTTDLKPVLKCLTLFDWSTIPRTVGVSIINKVTAILPSIQSPLRMRRLATIANSLVDKVGETALPLYLVAGMRLLALHESKEDGSHELLLEQKVACPLSCGSNCAAVVGDDHSLLFWGEFSPGTLRLRSERSLQTPMAASVPYKESEKSPESNPRSPQKCSRFTQQPSATIAKRKTAISTPTRKALPSSMEVKSVQCGTEHVLLLTDDGRVLSWGRNRYGQCGQRALRTEVEQPMAVTQTWDGEAVAIYSGHYHSAIIDQFNGVWLFGWGRHGQLATGKSDDSPLPIRVASTKFGNRRVLDVCLGYAHSLFLLNDGAVLGCGALTNGQLGVDPGAIKKGSCETGIRIKALELIALPFPGPIRLLASGYFSGLAVADDPESSIYVWGECPATLKMQSFLAKRLNVNTRAKERSGSEDTVSQPQRRMTTIPASGGPRSHMNIRKLCEWSATSASPIETINGQSTILTISAGYNHYSLTTSHGECYTWGKGLELQLGHGSKKDRAEPTLLPAMDGGKWLRVACARNWSAGLASDGRVFVWGRNDKNQLGLSRGKMPRSAARRIILKAGKGPKAIESLELPDDNNVELPTPLPSIVVDTESCCITTPKGQGTIAEESSRLRGRMESCAQQTLNAVSRHLAQHPLRHWLAVETHLLAGDLVHAVETAVDVWELRCRKDESTASDAIVGSAGGDAASDWGRGSLDKLWSLLPLYPTREIRQLLLVKMLGANLPTIRTRFSSDVRFVRLLDSFFEGLLPSSALSSRATRQPHQQQQHSQAKRKLSDYSVAEREAMLMSIFTKRKEQVRQRVAALRQRCEQALKSSGQLRFYSGCCHYERCIVESGPSRELNETKSRMRKCTRCVINERKQ